MLTVLKFIINWIKRMSSLLLALLLGSGSRAAKDLILFVLEDTFYSYSSIANLMGDTESDSLLIDAAAINAYGGAVSADGNTLFIVWYDFDASETNVSSFDVSDITNMSLTSTVTLATNIQIPRLALDKTKELVYVVGRNASGLAAAFAAIDVSNPASMTVTDTYSPSSSAAGFVIEETSRDVAYCSVSSTNSVISVDVSNTSALANLDSLQDNTNLYRARAMALDETGQVLYVGSGASGTSGGRFSSVDVSNTSVLAVLDTLTISGTPQIISVAFDGNYAYIWTDAPSVIAIDVSNPASMSISDTLTTSVLAPASADNNIVLVPSTGKEGDTLDTLILTSTSGNVQEIDVSNPAALSISNTQTLTSGASIYSVAGYQ